MFLPIRMLIQQPVRTAFQHLLGQKIIRQGQTLFSRGLWKLFLSNRLMPSLGGYKYFAAGEFERILDWLGLTKRAGYFVEAGACDGYSSSNTKYLELFCGWNGLLIEPFDPYVRVARLHRKGSMVMHSCLVPKDYASDTVSLEFAGLMTVTLLEDNAEILREQAALGLPFMSPFDESHDFEAPAITLESALEKAGAPRVIDLVSLDLEGVELAVLKGFNFQKWKVNYWLVESREDSKTQTFFEENGCRLVLNDPKTGMLFERLQESQQS